MVFNLTYLLIGLGKNCLPCLNLKIKIKTTLFKTRFFYSKVGQFLILVKIKSIIKKRYKPK